MKFSTPLYIDITGEDVEGITLKLRAPSLTEQQQINAAVSMSDKGDVEAVMVEALAAAHLGVRGRIEVVDGGAPWDETPADLYGRILPPTMMAEVFKHYVQGRYLRSGDLGKYDVALH